MEVLQTKVFGTINYSHTDGVFYNTQIEINSKKLECTVCILENEDNDLDTIVDFLDTIELLDTKSQNELKQEYLNSNTLVCDFIDEHFNEYGDETRQEIFEKLHINKQDNVLFIENVELGNILISSENDEMYITLDYNLIWCDRIPFTDQRLSVTYNQQYRLEHISHTS